MFVVFAFEEHEQVIDVSTLGGLLPRVGETVMWGYGNTTIPFNAYKVEFVIWQLASPCCVRVQLRTA